MMDMVKFGLVILLPSPQLHFGYLVMISFTSVFMGWSIFVVFIRQSYKIQRVGRRVEGEGTDEELEVLNKMIDKGDEEEEKEAIVIKT